MNLATMVLSLYYRVLCLRWPGDSQRESGRFAVIDSQKNLEKLNRGVSNKPGGFPLFSGKVQIVSQTLSGLFLLGAVNRPRKRKRTNRENPWRVHGQIGKIPEKSGKSQKGQKRTKKEGQVQIGKPPRLKHPRLAALEKKNICITFEEIRANRLKPPIRNF